MRQYHAREEMNMPDACVILYLIELVSRSLGETARQRKTDDQLRKRDMRALDTKDWLKLV